MAKLKINKYFDNAATSYPKPDAVCSEFARYIEQVGAPYGRGSYPRAFETAKVVEETRENLARLLGCSPEKLVYTFNATHGLNIILNSLAKPGSELLVSPLEHNAVMRPLEHFKNSRGITIKVMPHFDDGLVDVAKLKQAISPKTAFAIVNHQSNVNGLIQPLAEIKRSLSEVPLVVDAAQSLGETKLNIEESEIDYLAFTAHKGLLGPTGLGGMYLRNPERIAPLIYGGTGSNSESFVLPEFLPDRFEAGTHNIAGIFALSGAIKNRPKAQHSREEYFGFLDEISSMKNIAVYRAQEVANQGRVFSLNSSHYDCAELGQKLQLKYQLETRLGLHCAPLAHQTLKTYPHGSLRISASVYHSHADFDYFLSALHETNKL